MLLLLIIVSFLPFDFLSGDGEHHLQTNLHRWVSHTHVNTLTWTHHHHSWPFFPPLPLSLRGQNHASHFQQLRVEVHDLGDPEAVGPLDPQRHQLSRWDPCVSRWGRLGVLLPGREENNRNVTFRVSEEALRHMQRTFIVCWNHKSR